MGDFFLGSVNGHGIGNESAQYGWVILVRLIGTEIAANTLGAATFGLRCSWNPLCVIRLKAG